MDLQTLFPGNWPMFSLELELGDLVSWGRAAMASDPHPSISIKVINCEGNESCCHFTRAVRHLISVIVTSGRI